MKLLSKVSLGLGAVLMVVAFQNCSPGFIGTPTAVSSSASSTADSGSLPAVVPPTIPPTTPPAVDPPVVIAKNALKQTTLPGFPHAIDIYESAGATSIVVFLHGASGTNYQGANGLGLNSNSGPATMDSINWEWLNAHHVLAVFPQGQNIPEAQGGTTWSNHTMTSGQDDVAFLKALSTSLKSTYHLPKLFISGHSAGGSMTNRLWCEASEFFDGFIAFAGPASSFYQDPTTPCHPTIVRPYMGVIGSKDSIIRDSDWEAAQWTITPTLASTPAFLNPVNIGEWVQHLYRTNMMCAEVPLSGDKTTENNTEIWSNCSGKVRILRILGSDHGLSTMEAKSGIMPIDFVAKFIESQGIK